MKRVKLFKKRQDSECQYQDQYHAKTIPRVVMIEILLNYDN